MRNAYNFKELKPRKNPYAKLLKRQAEIGGDDFIDPEDQKRKADIADFADKLIDENDEALLALAESRLAAANEADYISGEDLMRELGITEEDLAGIDVEIE